MDEKEYNGWKNYATWAVKLHWDNNKGDYDFFTENAKKFKEAKKEIHEFGDFLKEQAEEIFNMVFECAESESKANHEAVMFMQDVRDLDEVDWYELAEAYYQEVE